jgi:hypothetical protein
MTGWRLGYAVWPGKLYDYARKLAVNLHSCVNAAAQYAGLAALTGPQDEVAKMVAEFDRAARSWSRAQPAARRFLRDAEGRVLRVPQHQAHRLEGEAARLGAARRCRRRAHRRAGFRHSRRRLYAAVLRQFDREHPARARSHGRLPRHTQGGSCRDFVDDVIIPFIRGNWQREWVDDAGRPAAAVDPRRRRKGRHPHARRAGRVRRHRARPGEPRCRPSR